MTTPKPPVAPTARKTGPRQRAAGSDTAKDPLSDMPPMPRTRPTGAAGAAPKAPTKPGNGAADGDGSAMVTKKEFFARVKARTGKVKGPEVRAVMDVLLDEIGAALVKGETLKLPALGTMKVQRRKPQAKADVVVCKLNRKNPGSRAKDPLAKASEEG